LFGLPPETSDRVVAGINRYAEELPIVFGSAIAGTAGAPTLEWEAPLLEIAREGLLMAGRREFEATIEELGVRIDDLGGLAGIPIDPDYAVVRAEAESAARRVIEDAAGDLAESLIEGLLGPLAEPAPAADEPSTPITDLLDRLLRPTQDPPDRDDRETEGE